MSRIGKKPIEIPQGVIVSVEGKTIKIEGPKGELKREIHPLMEVNTQGNQIVVAPREKLGKRPEKQTKSLWGLQRALIANMIRGVTLGYEKRLEIEGIGYRAELGGNELILSVGFTHPIKLKIPFDLQCSIGKNIIHVAGIDKEKVGTFAAKIRLVKRAEPYKGKGIRYEGEVIRRKLGKKVAATTGKP